MARAALDGTTDSDDADKGTPKVVERVFIVTSKYGSHQILSFLGNALHCKGVHWKSGKTGCPRETVRIALFGMPDHIERIHFLWDLLQPQALRALDLLPEDDSWYSTASVYRRSWVVGFAIGIAGRLREHEQHVVATAESGTAVVPYDLYKRDEERAAAVIRERWPDLDAEDPSDSFDLCGIEDGKRAAWSAWSKTSWRQRRLASHSWPRRRIRGHGQRDDDFPVPGGADSSRGCWCGRLTP